MWLRWLGSALLLTFLLAVGGGLVAWKRASILGAEAAAAAMPEPAESSTVATVAEREHRRTTTSVGTVLAIRSVTLRNEIAGTVARAQLTPGRVVEEGELLVALDTSVEQAELKAYEAQAGLSETHLERVLRLKPRGAATDDDVDRARSEREVALANVERVKAVIARKTIRSPFRARIGISDVHVGQYLPEGTSLTTLQGVDDAAHVDFTVTQSVAETLRIGDPVDVLVRLDGEPVVARITALDSRVDPTTRNASVRSRVDGVNNNDFPPPGASVRIRVPVGESMKVAAVPVSALRKGPEGDFVFVVATGEDSKPRARLTRVRSGPGLGSEVLILSGLAPGDQVAASGSFKLRDGGLVAVVSEPHTASDKTAAAAPSAE